MLDGVGASQEGKQGGESVTRPPIVTTPWIATKMSAAAGKVKKSRAEIRADRRRSLQERAGVGEIAISSVVDAQAAKIANQKAALKASQIAAEKVLAPLALEALTKARKANDADELDAGIKAAEAIRHVGERRARARS